MPSAVTLSTVNLQEIFNLTDKQGRGLIEIHKIGDLLRYAGLNPTERTCNQIIGKLCSVPFHVFFANLIEKYNKSHVTLADFAKIYAENQDAILEFKSISKNINGDNSNDSNSLNAMINAVRTFDHQGTGFISLNELKFGKNTFGLCSLFIYFFFCSINGIG